MSQAIGYWQPVVHCKNPECFFGKPTLLPYLNLPRLTEDQPNWPGDGWRPFLICRHCGLGYYYSKADVEWGGGQNKNGLPEHQLLLYTELQCAQKGCQHPVKLYIGFDDSRKDKDRDRLLKTGSTGAICEAGHRAAQPLRVIQSVFVNKIT